MQKTVTYFEKAGHENTAQCANIVRDAVKNSVCRHVVVATTSGDTGLMFAEALKDSSINLVVVTHSHGFKEPNHSEITDVVKDKIRLLGAKIYTGTILTHNLETALAVQFSGVYPTLLIAQTLRRFGEGAKVCCEIVMMAADAGLIPEGEEVIAAAGTARGSDTVMIIRSATSKRFLKLKVLEILAKPRG